MATTRRLNSLGLAETFDDLPDGPVVVALSGGADSAAAAWAAVRSGRHVRAVHVNHRQRASDRLERAACDVSSALRIDCCVVEAGGLEVFTETAARLARYELLLAELDTDEWLVTGHTADDVAETVLMNIVRGSGLDGLRGIPQLRAPVMRPLLDVRRAATREVATLAGLPWIDDPGNSDLRHLRNRVRSKLLRDLEETFGHAAVDGLLRTARTATMETAGLDAAADAAVRQPERLPGGGVAMVSGELVAAGRVLSARAIRNALRPIFGDKAPGNSIVESVLAVAAGRAPRLDLAHGWVAVAAPPMVEVVRDADHEVATAQVILGEGLTRWGDWTFEVSSGPAPLVRPLSNLAAVLSSPAETGKQVAVRSMREGDRLPVGGGHASVGDILAGAGIARHHRGGWPIVTMGQEIVWIPGIRRVGSPGAAANRYLWLVADRGMT